MKNIFLYIILCSLIACGTSKESYIDSDHSTWSNHKKQSENQIIHSLFLVGDAGVIDIKVSSENYVLTALKNHVSMEKAPSTLVYLGDNIYPNGLNPQEGPTRKTDEEILNQQLNVAPYVNGDTYFIPGNHDWNASKKGGKEYVQRQEEYIESYHNNPKNKVKMYPSDACGDPKIVEINKDLVFIFIDSQWWLQDWEQENEINKGCDVKSRADFIDNLRTELIDYKNDEVVIFMHHPMISNGSHGGNFSFKDHLFPLTNVNKNLWLPLPVIGSLYPLIRKTGVSRQDIPHELYQSLVQEISKITQSFDIHTIFASGHDHSLQYFDKEENQYIISGSGGKVTHTKKGGGASFVKSERGYAKVDFYENDESWLSFYTVTEDLKKPTLAFKTQLRKPKAGSEKIVKAYPIITPQDTILAVNAGMKAGKVKEFIMGEQYRDIWTTPLAVKSINIDSVQGGLIPVKKGGGMSSNSLRLEAKDGKEYILRSINKVFTRALPDDFKNLKLIEVIKDQNSAYHPYGALIIPQLSKAADVYYTEPELVYLKHQKGLGAYNEYFPEEMYLLEQRPDGDWSDNPLFGSSEKIVSYNDLLIDLKEKKNYYVDQEWTLKSRMFDIFIHDWDRHDDQWRWAEFVEGNKKIYRPIPRDRDLAFYKFVGVIPKFISSVVITKYKTMGENVKDIKSLTLNGKYFDRYFLNELEWNEWVPIIENLQANLTDDVILNSSDHLPPEVKEISDKELNEKLVSRRENLMEIGKRFYDLLSEEVEIIGTDNDEIFQIIYNDDESIQISYEILSKKNGLIKKYDRTFYPEETNEVRIYGLRGDDSFIVKGQKSDQIKIRIIGGEGDDVINNLSPNKNIIAYDDTSGLELKGNIKDQRSDAFDVNRYDRYGFLYDVSLFFPDFHYNRDGVWFGGAFTKINHEWREKPYKSKQTIGFLFAPWGQEAYRLDYTGHFPNLWGKIDFAPEASIDFPKNHNFFGYENESTNTLGHSDDYNWVRMNRMEAKPLLNISKGGIADFHFGPVFQTYDIYNVEEERIYDDPNLGFSNEDLKRKYFAGATATYDINIVDREMKPSDGFKLSLYSSYIKELGGDKSFVVAGANSQFYIPILSKPEVIIANNLGFEKLWGESYFYQAPTLGNKTGLRGLRNNRYIGNTSLYENIDLRIKILEWNNSYIPMDIGLVGGYDIGRVWYDEPHSNKWHKTQTLGVWLDVLGTLIVQPYYSFTQEGNTITLLSRFSF